MDTSTAVTYVNNKEGTHSVEYNNIDIRDMDVDH